MNFRLTVICARNSFSVVPASLIFGAFFTKVLVHERKVTDCICTKMCNQDRDIIGPVNVVGLCYSARNVLRSVLLSFTLSSDS